MLALFAACSAQRPVRAPPRAPAEVRAQLAQLIPASVSDRQGWAAEIQSAFQLLDIPASTENLCAALAVTEQESTYRADPVVPGLARIARTEIDRRAAQKKVPRFVVSAALKLKSADGRSFGKRLERVRTERELSGLYEEMIAKLPLGRRLLGASNPVRTGGPMQVSIDFAQRHAREHGYPYAGGDSIRHEVFTRRGGLYFGIAHLLGYPTSYDRHIHRFADFNAGWYASRNAAFQAAVTEASGVALALDGDIVLEGGRVGATEAAVRSLAPQLDMSHEAIHRQLLAGDRLEFERTELYRRVFALAEQRAGRALPRAVIPRITLQSPKITRELTTEWFATRVQTRYQRCVNRAFASRT
ncbi:DUF1615 domain-containing protein [Lysobacter sp. M15]|uniref:DUF1615 domain-containing protein n=1 Tax=Lysobacter sp. M15 TaxID=2916837 RepID=UPI001F580217|nr:DUF1615 domain-containing protein [Lysobacter sp. M15]